MKARKELPDFIEGEACLSRFLDHGKALKHGLIVAPLSAGAQGRSQDPNLLVITDGGGPQADLLRHLGNCQLGHSHILVFDRHLN